jgi:hypothetical protein
MVLCATFASGHRREALAAARNNSEPDFQVCALALVPAHIKLLDHNVLAQPFEIDREHSSSNGRRYKYVETMP